MKEEYYEAPKHDGKVDRLTILECKNGHVFKIEWSKMSIVELVPA